LHGWGGSKESLKGLANALKSEFCVTLVDFYGSGDTPHPPHPLYLEDFVSAIVDLINYYRMSGVVLVGHSFGGRVAVMLAARYGHLLDRVILIDGAGIKPKRSFKYYFRLYKYKLCKLFKVKTLPKGSADYNALSGAARATFVNIVNFHLDNYLKYITLPVLIIWGESDTDTPLYMAKKLNRIKNSSLVILQGAGHFSYLDCPSECSAAIKDFLGGADD